MISIVFKHATLITDEKQNEFYMILKFMAAASFHKIMQYNYYTNSTSHFFEPGKLATALQTTLQLLLRHKDTHTHGLCTVPTIRDCPGIYNRAKTPSKEHFIVYFNHMKINLLGMYHSKMNPFIRSFKESGESKFTACPASRRISRLAFGPKFLH